MAQYVHVTGGRGMVVALVGAACVAAGCSGSGDAADPGELLGEAAGVLEATSSVRFALTSADVPDGATALVGGEGDAERPDRFAGDLDVVLAGSAVAVSVVSIDGTLYAQLPFSPGFTETDPETIGIADPGALLAPDAGVTRLLTEALEPTAAGEARVGDTVVEQVQAELPAETVAGILVAADGAGPFDAVLGVDPDTGQLRTAEITGEFLVAGTDTTYTIELSAYDEPVDIVAPTG